MRKIRILSLLLTACLLTGILTVPALADQLLIAPSPTAAKTNVLLPKTKTYSGQLKDAAGAWCKDAIKTVYEAGLM